MYHDEEWIRRHSSFPGKAQLQLKGISTLRQYTKKKAINPTPHPDLQDHQFLGLLAFPTMHSFSFLLYK
jgi:hypothetical protein